MCDAYNSVDTTCAAMTQRMFDRPTLILCKLGSTDRAGSQHMLDTPYVRIVL